MTAPTEAEIREAIAADTGSWRQLEDGFTGLVGGMDSLYDAEEFRKSELDEFDAIGYEAIEALQTYVKREITEHLVAGMLAFAREHPDAPRKPQPVPVPA